MPERDALKPSVEAPTLPSVDWMQGLNELNELNELHMGKMARVGLSRKDADPGDNGSDDKVGHVHTVAVDSDKGNADRSPKRTNAASAEKERSADPETEKFNHELHVDVHLDLPTGDKLTISKLGELLDMPNGDSLLVSQQQGLFGFETSWGLMDGNGQSIPSEYSHTIAVDPEISVSRFANGATMEQQGNVYTLIYPNGDRVEFDRIGVTEVNRGRHSVHFRDAIRPPSSGPASDEGGVV